MCRGQVENTKKIQKAEKYLTLAGGGGSMQLSLAFPTLRGDGSMLKQKASVSSNE